MESTTHARCSAFSTIRSSICSNWGGEGRKGEEMGGEGRRGEEREGEGRRGEEMGGEGRRGEERGEEGRRGSWLFLREGTICMYVCMYVCMCVGGMVKVKI